MSSPHPEVYLVLTSCLPLQVLLQLLPAPLLGKSRARFPITHSASFSSQRFSQSWAVRGRWAEEVSLVQLPNVNCLFRLQAGGGWSSCTGQVIALVSVCFPNTDIALKTCSSHCEGTHACSVTNIFIWSNVQNLIPGKNTSSCITCHLLPTHFGTGTTWNHHLLTIKKTKLLLPRITQSSRKQFKKHKVGRRGNTKRSRLRQVEGEMRLLAQDAQR